MLKNMFKSFFKTDDKHEFKPIMIEIEETPISPLGRMTLWVIISTMLFFGIWMFVGKIDVVVSGRGKAVPEGEVKLLQPIETGVVSKILVKEGSAIEKGAVLMEIDSSVTQTDLESKKRNLKATELEIKRIKAILSRKPFVVNEKEYDISQVATEKSIYFSTISAYENKLLSKEADYKSLKEEYLANELSLIKIKSLLEQSEEQIKRLEKVLDIIAKEEYEKAVSNKINLANSYDSTKSKKEELIHRIKQSKEEISFMVSSFKMGQLTQLNQKLNEASLLTAEIEGIAFRNAKQRIISPVSGYIGQLFVHTIGGVVTPAQKLMSVVPQNTPIVLKVNVFNKDIGFVKNGMDVAIKIDTFDFQKYGTMQGKIKHVSKDSIEDEKLGSYYEVFVEPTQNTIMVDGQKVPLTVGMSLTGEIKVGKRRIIEFFIYPLIKYLDEGMSVR